HAHARSFPPRRSSDLPRRRRTRRQAVRRRARRCPRTKTCKPAASASRNVLYDSAIVCRVLCLDFSALATARPVFGGLLDKAKGRSEEHTSELQSRENL